LPAKNTQSGDYVLLALLACKEHRVVTMSCSHSLPLKNTDCTDICYTETAVLPVNSCWDVTLQLTPIASETTAYELVDTVLTRSSVLAGITRALVHVAEAARIVVTTWTLALKAVHKVHANTTIRTRIAGTFIDVGLTVLASEPRDAVT
jgi:hypothetical protein